MIKLGVIVNKVINVVLLGIVFVFGVSITRAASLIIAEPVCKMGVEEFGSCTIVASPAGAIVDPSREGYRPCSMGRIELAWLRKPTGVVLVKIAHIEVDQKHRARGIGAVLFNGAVHFILRHFAGTPRIVWKAQPLFGKLNP